MSNPVPCILTGTLTGLKGDIQQSFTVPLEVDDSVDTLTGNYYHGETYRMHVLIIFKGN